MYTYEKKKIYVLVNTYCMSFLIFFQTSRVDDFDLALIH